MSNVNVEEHSNENGQAVTEQKVNDDDVEIQKADVVTVNEQKPKIESQISMVDLDRIVADSLKDIEVFDDDGDDDDPALLNELSHIIHPEDAQDAVNVDRNTSTHAVPASVLTLLKQRIEMYKIAEANALSANESSRARRFSRGLSTLETMLNEALAGFPINVEDIPPEVMTGVKDNSPEHER